MIDLKILDMCVIERLADEISPEAIPQIMSLYEVELGETLENLLQYYSNDDQAFEKTLHKAKSSSAIFGARKFNHYVTEAEDKVLSNKQLDELEIQMLHDVGVETIMMVKNLIPKELSNV